MAEHELTLKVNGLPGPTHKLCVECQRYLEPKQFPGGVGHKGRVCRECLRFASKRQLREELAKLQEVVCQGATKELVAARAGDKINAPHISEVAATLIGMFGGVEGYAKTYYEQIQCAIEDRPGSSATLQHLNNIAKMIIASTEHRSSAPDVAAMTDEQLQVEYRNLALQSIVNDSQTMRKLLAFAKEYDPALLDDEATA